MSALDIIELPGQAGLFARRVIVDAWVRAGSPWVNDAGRLKEQQQRAWDAYRNGTGSPADDPNRPELFPLAHVRFVALDITPTPSRVAALSAQGLVRPYSYEPWHWQVPGDVRRYALVESIPSTATDRANTFDPSTILEEAMGNPIVNVVAKNGEPAQNGTLWIGRSDGTFERYVAPFDPNVRGVISVVFHGGKGTDDLTPTINPRDFQTVQRLWKTMCGAV